MHFFTNTDSVVAHLNQVVPTIADPVIQIKYAGFVAVSSVAVYEMAIKEILIDFAHSQHKLLGNFTEASLERLNGNIRIKTIRERVGKFDATYEQSFAKKIEEENEVFLKTHKRSFISAYGNLIQWRNSFAHEGNITSNITYNDVIQAYEDGKQIIYCLREVMK
jgi:hypothetical protein